jgi:hypothetical protein
VKPGAVLYAKEVAKLSAFYVETAGLAVTRTEADHTVLESPVFQLVLLAIPAKLAATIEVASPPVLRENTPIKLVFPVASLQAARAAAARLGGGLKPAEREWKFQTIRVCDGHDPEGNIVQFRESAD